MSQEPNWKERADAADYWLLSAVVAGDFIAGLIAALIWAALRHVPIGIARRLAEPQLLFPLHVVVCLKSRHSQVAKDGAHKTSLRFSGQQDLILAE